MCDQCVIMRSNLLNPSPLLDLDFSYMIDENEGVSFAVVLLLGVFYMARPGLDMCMYMCMYVCHSSRCLWIPAKRERDHYNKDNPKLFILKMKKVMEFPQRVVSFLRGFRLITYNDVTSFS